MPVSFGTIARLQAYNTVLCKNELYVAVHKSVYIYIYIGFYRETTIEKLCGTRIHCATYNETL